MNRITAFMLFNQFSNSLTKNLSGMGKVQTQLATGKRLTKPSDDVISLRGSMAFKVSINALEQFGRNINEGISAFNLTESALNSTTNLLNRVRELAVSESNDTANAETRGVTAYEVRNLFDQMIDIGNSKLKDKYLFSGYMTKTKSFSAAGAYQGDTNNLEIYIGDGIKSKMNITGDVAFSDTSRLSTANLPATMSGNLRITSDAGTPYYLEAGDVFANASPEEVRDTLNAAMTGPYDSTVPEAIGTGRLILKAGGDSAVTLTVDNTNDEPSQIRDAVNGLNMGITAGIFTDAAGNERLFFRPTTPGQGISIEVTDDDGDDTDSSGLSALHHTDLSSNLTRNALGVEAFVIDDGTNKRMILEPSPSNTSFTIDVDEAGDGWNGADDIDTTGLSNLYHQSSTVTNLNNSISFFTMLNHFANALTNNDSTGIQASIFLLDGALNSVVNTTADVGARLKYFEDQSVRLEDSGVSFKESLAVLEDADIAEAAMEMTKIQSTLEAMRISTVRNLTKSLFDFMG